MGMEGSPFPPLPNPPIRGRPVTSRCKISFKRFVTIFIPYVKIDNDVVLWNSNVVKFRCVDFSKGCLYIRPVCFGGPVFLSLLRWLFCQLQIKKRSSFFKNKGKNITTISHWSFEVFG